MQQMVWMTTRIETTKDGTPNVKLLPLSFVQWSLVRCRGGRIKSNSYRIILESACQSLRTIKYRELGLRLHPLSIF